MPAKFFADDGTEFKGAHECQAYERELHEKSVNEVPLEQRANKVVEVFENVYNQKALDDEYLDEVGKPTRYAGGLPLVGDYSYSVLYLRDDAVGILVARIRQLEAENERIIGQLPRKIQNEEIKRLAAELRNIGK